MKKKSIIIIIVIVVIIIGLWALGYSLLKRNDQRIRDEAIFKAVNEYVQSDSDFISQYGTIYKIDLYQNESIAFINDKKCNVPCVIITESEQSYLVWIEYDFSGEKDVFKYISVTLISDIT